MLKTERMLRPWPQAVDMTELTRHPETHYTPSKEWVVSSFASTVRLGTGAERTTTHWPQERKFATCDFSVVTEQISRISLSEVVEPSEARWQHIAKTYSVPQEFDPPAQALSILADPLFRKGALSLFGTECIQETFEKLQRTFLQHSPFRIVVPTLPFKDQTPVTTQQPIDQIDLGEWLFIARMGLLVRSLRAVLRAPVSVELVSDGLAYVDIFTTAGAEQAQNYFAGCQASIESLGLDSHVLLHQLSNIVAKEERFEDVQTIIKTHLLELQQDREFIHLFHRLLRGMLFNTELPGDYNTYASFTQAATMDVLQIKQELPVVYDRLYQATLEYSSFLLTMRRLNILNRWFRGQSVLRATVHPKAGQWGLHTLGSGVAPYNGITLVDLEQLAADPSLTNDSWYTCMRHWKLLERSGMRAALDEHGATMCFVSGNTD